MQLEENPYPLFPKPLLTASLLSLLVLAGMAWVGVFDQDEAAYAGFGYRMLTTDDWLVPDFLWSDPHRKTPLHFWAVTLCFKLFGFNSFALRLPATLSVIGTAWAVWLGGRGLFGDRVALRAAVLLLGSLLSFVYGAISFTDGMLMCCETAAALALLHFYYKSHVKYLLVLFLAVAAGGLTKGPPIFILIYGMIFLFGVHRLLYNMKPDQLLKASYGHNTLAGLVVTAAFLPTWYWGYLCWQRDNGAFITWLIDWYITKRAGSAVWGQTGPPGYHLLIMGLSAVAVLPAYLVALGNAFSAIKKGIWRLKVAPNDLSRKWFILWIWLVPGWLFYELQFSKLPSYALGAYGGMALLVAWQGSNLTAESKTVKWAQYTRQFLAAVLALGGAALAILAVYGLVQGWPWYLMLLGAAGGALAAWAWYAVFKLKPGDGEDWFRPLQYVQIALIGIAFGLCAVEPIRNMTGSLAQQAGEVQVQAGKPLRVLMLNHYSQPSLPYYLGLEGVAYKYEEGAEAGFMALKNNTADIVIAEPETWAKVATALGADSSLYMVKYQSGLVTDRASGTQYCMAYAKSLVKR